MLLALEALPAPGFGGDRPSLKQAAAYVGVAANRETALVGHRGPVRLPPLSPPMEPMW